VTLKQAIVVADVNDSLQLWLITAAVNGDVLSDNGGNRRLNG